ncbi:MAG: hypothetical protein O3C21_21080 [Verrucomicrobia bacterium]|nr:hypothetical protein [Verrucomicrobiota bacterium]
MAELLDIWDIEDENETSEMAQVLRHLRNYFPENVNVDLPDTAAQDSASKSNSPAVSG